MKRLVRFIRPSQSRWVYLLPALHLCACIVSMLGYLWLGLQYLGIVWTFVMLADLPISLVAFGLAWKHGLLAAMWVVVAGTLWWYILSRVAEYAFNKFRLRDAPHEKTSPSV